MAPHNLGEICDAITAVIDNPDISLMDLMQIVGDGVTLLCKR